MKEKGKMENVRLCGNLEGRLGSFRDHNNYGEILWMIIDFHLNSITSEAKEIMKKLI